MSGNDVDDPLYGVFPQTTVVSRRGLPQPCLGGGYAQPAPPAPSDLTDVFPEFTNVPTARIQFQLNIAAESVRASYWQDRWFSAVLLYAAHYLAVGAPASTLVNGAYNPSGGLAQGVLSSKSVGGVSKSYNTSLGTTEGGGSFNLTIYGQQYLTMRDSGPAVGLQL